MDYYQEKYLDRPCNYQMSEKLGKKPKDTMEGFEYASLFSSRTYSILSYIVGGFVGSKSQMNNNKHNLSYDLSAAIFNLLNPCKYEREKGSMRRTNENNFYAAATKINSECYDKYIVTRSSQKVEKVTDCIVDMMELELLSGVPLLDHGNFVLDLNNGCYDRKKNLQEEFHDTYNCDKKYGGDVEKTVPEECFGQSESKTNSPVDDDSSVCEDQGCVANESQPERGECLSQVDSENSKVSIQLEDISCDTTSLKESPRHSIIFPGIQRLRQYSECSVDSTDSESFIVFDDLDQDECGCLKSEDYDSEDGNGEEESSCDEYDFCSADKELVEANDRWRRNYQDVADEDDVEVERKVRFNDDVKVNKIVAWDFAYRAARAGPWEQMARDRFRFQERILRASVTICPILGKGHREKIYKELYS